MTDRRITPYFPALVLWISPLWVESAHAQAAFALSREGVDSTEIDTTVRNIFGSPADPIDDPIVTDRPDFTESTEAVPIGRFQLEAGYTFTRDRQDAVLAREHTTPEMLLRIGLMKNIELRLGWDGYTYTHTRENERVNVNGTNRRVTTRDWQQGANDLSIGAKFKLLEQDGWIPHFGIITAMTVPTGSANVSSNDVDPELILAWAYDVNDWFSIAGNVGLATPTTEPGHRFFQTSASLSFAFAITDEWGAYVEYFGFYPNDRHTDAAHLVNGGFTYLITNNLQLDWRIGMGLSDQAPDVFTGAGISFRF